MRRTQPKPRLVAGSDIPLTAPAIDDPQRLITSSYILGDLSIGEMTLWRWCRHPDPAQRFPSPDVVLSGKKRLWKLGRYAQWKRDLLARGTASMSRRK